ncbi:MAG: hypothetical protein WBO48_05370 [Candidatus Promineifilaceae bacterium]
MAKGKTMEMQSDLKQKIDELAGERRLPTWREMNWDTTTEADAVLFKLWRETPAWRKLEMMEGLNQAARRMALIGLRQRFPDATPEELKRRLAVIILGEALATRAYGPISH